MRRGSMVAWIIVAGSLVLGLASRGEAALGCFRDEGFSAATCTEAADCALVGGVDCTGSPGATICFCPGSVTDPFCPCAASIQAPVLSPGGNVGAVALVAAIGLLGLWRAARVRHDAD